jgi:hypothetical protein
MTNEAAERIAVAIGAILVLPTIAIAALAWLVI